MPGTYQCDNDKLTCTGGVGPMPEACNCKDDDCNGKIDDNAFCPMGTDCVSYSGACGCYGKCGGGEFPCPVGYDCIDVVKKMACDSPGDPNVPCYCLPEQTCDPPCAADENCVQQPPPATKGMCVSKCAGVMCPPGSQCKNGQCLSCVEDPSMCKACANGMGERCDTSARKCVPDLCCGVTCGANETCQPLTGQCTKSCANVNCSSDQICVDGACVDNKCKGVMCPEGKTCDPSSGMCVSDVCRSKTCQAGQACCMGGCTSDPCAAVQCATGFKCTVNTLNCNVSCDQPVVPESQ
jgi:hypothetical protein